MEPHLSASTTAVRARSWSRSLVGVVLLVALAAFAYRGLAAYEPPQRRGDVQGMERLLFSPEGSSPLLVYGVAAWLLYRRRTRLLDAIAAARVTWPASIPLAAASTLCVWAYYVDAPELLIPSLSLMALGTAGAVGGWPGARAVLVPAVFLALAFPPPGVIVNAIMFPLQLATARITSELLGWIGIHSVVSGDLILTGRGVFQVIESCSGYRLMETLLMSAVVYAELLGRRGLQALVLVVASPFIGMLTNQVRVISIVLNPYSEFAGVHTLQGLVMLVVGVLLLAVFEALVARLWPRREPPTAGPAWVSERRGEPAVATRRLLAPCALLALLGLITSRLPAWSAVGRTLPPLSTLPVALDGWSAKGLGLDRDFLGTVHFSEWVHRRYTRGEQRVDVFVAADDRLDPGASLLSSKTAFPGAGWVAEPKGRAALGPEGPVVEVSVQRSREGAALVYHWYEGVDGPAAEAGRALLALDRGPLRREGRALVYRLSTPLARDAAGLAQAERELDEFVPRVRQALGPRLEPAEGSR